MAFYREGFPQASILPKMHMLEAHVVPAIQHYGVGLGLMGEQGAESIHAAINAIKRSYSNMPEKVMRLECIVKEHHRQVCPTLAIQKPEKKKRKFTKDT